MAAGVRKESLYGHDMVTGATKQIRNRHDNKNNLFENRFSATTLDIFTKTVPFLLEKEIQFKKYAPHGNIEI